MVEKLPEMEKHEYDQLIEKNYICRVAFNADKHPHMAPFIYVFDGDHMHFLSTKYGRKLKYFERDPNVTVEVEQYEPDLSKYSFVTLSGRLEEVEDEERKQEVREAFVNMIRQNNLSKQVLTAIGHKPDEPLENVAREDRHHVWKLVDIEEVRGLSGGE